MANVIRTERLLACFRFRAKPFCWSSQRSNRHFVSRESIATIYRLTIRKVPDAAGRGVAPRTAPRYLRPSRSPVAGVTSRFDGRGVWPLAISGIVSLGSRNNVAWYRYPFRIDRVGSVPAQKPSGTKTWMPVCRTAGSHAAVDSVIRSERTAKQLCCRSTAAGMKSNLLLTYPVDQLCHRTDDSVALVSLVPTGLGRNSGGGERSPAPPRFP